MKIRYIPIFLFILTAFCWAEDFSVIYLAGDAALADDTLVQTGDILTESDVVVLTDGSVLELQGSAESLTLVGPGRYSISGLTETREKRSGFSIANLLQTKLQRMVSGTPAGDQSTVMGVRGAASDADELTWMDGESDVYITAGRDYLKNKSLPLAADSFEEGIDTASLYGEYEAEMELRFLLSYTRALQGRRGEALSLINQVSADPYLEWYPEYRLHHAQLLLGAGANAEAAKILEAEEETVALSGEEKLILGIALYDLGGSEKRRGEALLRELAAADSELSPTAKAYLGQ